ncbi:MAG: hypothetical protein IPL49_20815 [Saprospirales bacterium]|nr:hypothetical protein [Saprospirales bacterium]MBK8493253.1 hypothetical protein [Saprospirales bacterium]
MKKSMLILLASLFFLPSLVNAQGCVEPSSDERITVIGYIQAQAEYQFLGEDILGNSLNTNSFYFNRARLGVTGVIPYDFSYYFMAEFSPTFGGPYILDAFISYRRFAPYINASIGQFKSPFGLELLTPCHKLHTINRSLVVTDLVNPFRDLGFMVFGGTGDLSVFGSKTKNLFGYNLAIMNGTGINVKDDNGKKDLIGRLTFHPFEFLTIGSSYRFGKQPPKIEGIKEDDERSRMGLDLEFKYKGILLQGEYVKGTDKGSYTTGGGCGGEVEVHQGSINRNGFFAQAAYMTPWKIQPVVRYESYEPNMDADYTDDIKNVITYGVNYFFNDRTRLQINYLYKAEESARVEVPNDELLLQVQIEF